MSGPNVIPLDPSRRTRTAVVEDGPNAMLVFVIFDAMMFTGLVSVFMLTRAAAGGVWPPTGQPWFPLAETIINSVALLGSGGLVLLAAHAWQKRETRTGPLLTTAIALGAFFVFFQGVLWVSVLRQGLTLTSSQHGSFFCFIVGMHGAQTVGALVFLTIAWLHAKRGSASESAFSAARILWYFVVGVWPVLYLCLYL